MRVVHVNTERGWRGGEQQLGYLVRGLREHGVEQTVVCQADGALRERLEDEGIDTLPLKLGGYADLRSSWKISRHVRKHGADVLHLHTGQAHAIGVRAARWSGKPRPRTVIARRVAYSIFRHSFFRLNRIKYTRTVDRILCVTDAVRRVLIDDGLAPDRLAVVHDGIDPARFVDVPDESARHRAELGVADDAWVVGAVGALTPEKGHAVLIDALPLLRETVPGACVVIVGDGRLRAELEQQAEARGVRNLVRFAGFREDVPSLLRWFDALAFPSLMEGMGSTILDALCLATPVAASRTGGIPEVLRHEQEGLLVEPGDARALAAALARLHAEPDQARTYGIAGRDRVMASFTYETTVSRTLEAYRALLAERGTNDSSGPVETA